jgi:hypothetical protein
MLKNWALKTAALFQRHLEKQLTWVEIILYPYCGRCILIKS